MVALRDSLDQNRNIIFKRERDNCQTLIAEVRIIFLTYQSPALLLCILSVQLISYILSHVPWILVILPCKHDRVYFLHTSAHSDFNLLVYVHIAVNFAAIYSQFWLENVSVLFKRHWQIDIYCSSSF